MKVKMTDTTNRVEFHSSPLCQVTVRSSDSSSYTFNHAQRYGGVNITARR